MDVILPIAKSCYSKHSLFSWESLTAPLIDLLSEILSLSNHAMFTVSLW